MSTATYETPQRMEALAKANRARSGGREVQVEYGAGHLTLLEALEDPRAGCVPVARLLASKRRFGPKKANKLCQRVRIFPTKRCDELTDRQRREIVRISEEGVGL